MFKRKARVPANHHAHPRQPARDRPHAIALAAALCAVALPTVSRAHDSAALKIEASGFNDESGHAIAKLFIPGQNVPTFDKPRFAHGNSAQTIPIRVEGV